MIYQTFLWKFIKKKIFFLSTLVQVFGVAIIDKSCTVHQNTKVNMDFKILKSTTKKKQGLETCGVSSPSSYHRRSCAPAAAPVVVAAVAAPAAPAVVAAVATADAAPAAAVAVIDTLSGLGLAGVFVVFVFGRCLSWSWSSR